MKKVAFFVNSLSGGGAEKILQTLLNRWNGNRWQVVVYSDSRYVVDAVEKGWVFGWEKKGFKDKKNPDLWKRFLAIYRQHQVKFVWVKGHADIPENERCDQLAVAAYKAPNLQIDEYYEAEQNSDEQLFSE